jgi:hypothetical protein
VQIDSYDSELGRYGIPVAPDPNYGTLNRSQDRLGVRTGLSGKFLGEVERGEKSISLDNLARVARAVGVPLEAMVKGLGVRTQ